MEEVGLQEVAHDTGNMSKHVESWVDMAQQEFSIGCLSVGIAERSIYVVIPPGVLLVRRDKSPRSFFGQLHQKQTCHSR